jgi:DNA ligase (NAD+)
VKHSEAAARIAKLRDQINEYRYQYHVLNNSIMSEAAADSLKHELSQLEADFPELVTSDSPTQRVAGRPLGQFAAVPHQVPMLSLNDVFDHDEVEAWVRRCEKLVGHEIHEFFVEIKKDGLAGAVIYEDGLLTQGLTRGDGRLGEDVTHNFKTIESIPLRLRPDPEVPQDVYTGRFEVRGEVLLYKDDFAALNKRQESLEKPLFANPRNTAAGTIRQLDARLVAERKLRFLAYFVPVAIRGSATLAEDQAILARLGFAVEPHSKVLGSVDEIMTFADEWKDKRQQLPFGTDGLVITVNDKADFEKLGVVGKARRGSAAFKFPAEQVTTRLRDIQVSMGRTGAATPFAVLEPVAVAGSTVSLATLHNENEIRRKDIRIGDTVIIQKAGDIIPEVVESLPKLRTGTEKVFEMPENCPVCTTKLEKKREDEVIWRCPNFFCPALERGRIIHFASKDAYDIEGLGEKVVDVLLENKLIEDAADLFTLKPESIAQLERFGELSAHKLVTNIQGRKHVTLDRYLYGLGIRHVGAQTASDLATHFGTLERFRAAEEEQLMEVPGIGVVVAESIAEWLSEERNRELLEKLDSVGVRPEAVKRVEGRLTGQSFVITGTLTVGSREGVEERIKALGGTAQSTVTKDTTYLVVGEDPGASKIAKAKKYGTKQIDEAELTELLG